MSDNSVPAVVTAEDRWLAILEKVLAQPALPIDNLERILALRTREREAAAQEDFNRALASCQAEIKEVGKDKTNPAFRSRYSSLAAVDEAIRPVREKYGLGWVVSQAQAEGAGNVRYQGTIIKGSIERTVYLEVDRAVLTGEGPRGGRIAQTPVQTVGSVTSYMRRYLLMMAFDIVPVDLPEDDDGEGMRHAPQTKPWTRDVRNEMPYDASRQQQVSKAQDIIANGNGRKPNGGGTWLDRFETGMEAAQTQEDWDRITTREDVRLAEAQLKGEELKRFDAIKERTANRLFPAPPDYGNE